jgi:hypothetical protein
METDGVIALRGAPIDTLIASLVAHDLPTGHTGFSNPPTRVTASPILGFATVGSVLSIAVICVVELQRHEDAPDPRNRSSVEQLNAPANAVLSHDELNVAIRLCPSFENITDCSLGGSGGNVALTTARVAVELA